MSGEQPAETHDLERRLLVELAADEDYWDYLDELEVRAGACREWDNATTGGAS